MPNLLFDHERSLVAAAKQKLAHDWDSFSRHRTESENRVLGPYREQVVDAARAVAHDAVGQLRTLGEDAGEAAIAQLETAGMTRG